MGKTVLISSHVLSDLAGICGRLVVLEKGRSVFSGTVEELKQKVMPGRRVEIGVEGDAEAGRRFLASQPWTRDVRPLGDGCLEVVLDAGGVALAEVSSALSTAGFRIVRFLERELDLEEAFLRVTKGAAP
jgi:ABC-2 type transport system ATP-binding protein